MHWEIRRLYDALSDLLVDADTMLVALYGDAAIEHEPPSFHRARVILRRVEEYEQERHDLHMKHVSGYTKEIRGYPTD